MTRTTSLAIATLALGFLGAASWFAPAYGLDPARSLDSRAYAPIVLPALPAATSRAPVHERALYGWNPSYTPNLPAFDSSGIAHFRKRGPDLRDTPPDGFEHFDGSSVVVRPYMDSALTVFPAGTALVSTMSASGWVPSYAVFDEQDTMYTVLGVNVRLPTGASDSAWVLLHSPDRGETWNATLLARKSDFPPAGGACPWPTLEDPSCKFPTRFFIEQPYSARPIQGAPTLAFFQPISEYDGGYPDSNDYGRYVLLVFDKLADNRLSLRSRAALSESAMSFSHHSGGSNKLIRQGDKVFLAWSELDPRNERTNVQVGTYDVMTERVSRDLVMQPKPGTDGHVQPALAATSDGILHVVSGSHNGHFLHAHSLRPFSTAEGWSTPVVTNAFKTGDEQVECDANLLPLGGCQTYASLVAEGGNLHLVFRLTRVERDRYDGAPMLTLAYQRYANEEWSAPEVLVYPNQHPRDLCVGGSGGERAKRRACLGKGGEFYDASYTIYYHHMTIGRRGIYLVYSQWRQIPPYMELAKEGGDMLIPRNANAALLMSADSGHTWSLASDADIAVVED